MDRLPRLIVALVLLVSGAAHAEGIVQPSTVTTYDRYFTVSSMPGGRWGTPSALCDASAASAPGYVCHSVAGTGFDSFGTAVNTGYCIRQVSTGTTYCNTAVGNNVASSPGCPANSAITGTTCTCGSGYQPSPDGRTCVAQSGSCQTLVNAANAAGLDGVFVSSAAPGSTDFCTGGCYVGGTGAVSGKTAGGAWRTEHFGPFTLKATTCPPTGVPSTGTQETPPCPSGQLPGTFNGVTVCKPASTTTTKTGSTGTDGSGNSTGSSESTTTCSGTQCTTSTTTRNAAGAITGTTVTTADKDRFCDVNPDTTICKKSSFAQSCAAAVSSATCEGDAVQCAIAKEQHKRNCELFEAAGATRTLGEEAMARGDTRANDHPGATANIVTIGNGTSGVDSSDLLSGSATCPSDEVVTISGSQTVTIAWSKLCTPVGYLGNILVGLTALAWVFIAFKQG
jgi:hypothetical protein